jgi:CobQ-like glutamine amidotransferase family enzyme
MKIEVLFPEICNLYGDLFNAKFLVRSCPKIEIVNTSLKSDPLFLTEKPSLIYMGCTTERGQEMVAAKLLPYKDRIINLIDDGALFFITGNAGELFGTHIEQENGESIECLGIFPIYSKRQMMSRYNSLYIGKFGNMDIVGFKNQFSHSYGDNSSCYLFETTRGDGLNPGVKYEGIRKNNFFSTYVIGPLLVLNPPMAKHILSLMGVSEPHLEFEEECLDAYRTRVKEFSEPSRGFSYSNPQ